MMPEPEASQAGITTYYNYSSLLHKVVRDDIQILTLIQNLR